MYTDPLQFTLYMVYSTVNLQKVLDSHNYSLYRRNKIIEDETPISKKQYDWWWILANKVELECIVVEDLIKNFDIIKDYL